MLRLEEKQVKYQELDQDVIDQELAKLDALGDKQVALGLGRPYGSIAKVKEKLNLAKFAREFTPIWEPALPKFRSQWREATSETKFEVLPTAILLELSESNEKVVVNINYSPHSASIPLIPEAVLAQVQKAKEIIPTAKFLLAFVPQWQFDPKADPVLLAEVQGEFFRIASWGGDQDIISEYVLSKLV